jgi:hypothetical protein
MGRAAVEQALLALALRRVRGHVARADAPGLDELALALDAAMLAARAGRGRWWWGLVLLAFAAGLVVGRLARSTGASGPRRPPSPPTG